MPRATTPSPALCRAPRSTDALRGGARAALLLAAAGLAGCGAPPFEGQFRGTCNVGEGTDAFALPIEFTVIEGDEGDVLGYGAFRFNEYTFTGEAAGSRADERVMVDVIGVAGGYTITVRVIGEVNEELSAVEGRCGFVDQGEGFVGGVKMIAPDAEND
jgi:hypothetical protein